jgi:hypothetical protein
MSRHHPGQPVMHHPRPAPRCAVDGCKRNGHYHLSETRFALLDPSARGLCARHADEAAQRQFAVLDSYLGGGPGPARLVSRGRE